MFAWFGVNTYAQSAKQCCSLLEPVSHQPCSSRAPICEDKFLCFVQQPQGVVYYTARLPYNKQGRKAAATSKTKFSTCSFSLGFVCVF